MTNGPTSPPTTVVITVYGALREAQGCLRSVVQHTSVPHEVVVIDDASRSPEVWRTIDGLASSVCGLAMRAVRHERNCGYTASINHGIQLAGSRDVVLLNSDTRVTEGWLDKLWRAAASRDRVATVTPVSNAAGAFSVPRRHEDNPIPAGMTVDDLAAIVDRVSPRRYPEVPTGNGFCMLVRREALDQVGEFDERAFPFGYGEENDLCCRASAAGFVHLVDDATYIYHARGASVGRGRAGKVRRGQRILRRRYPDYERRVAAWLADDPVDELRRRMEAELARLGGGP